MRYYLVTVHLLGLGPALKTVRYTEQATCMREALASAERTAEQTFGCEAIADRAVMLRAA